MDIDKNSDPCSLPTMGSSNRPMTAGKETIERIEPWLFSVSVLSRLLIRNYFARKRKDVRISCSH